jgi:hypothetical protein
MHSGRCGNTLGQKCHTKGSREETRINARVYVEHEMNRYTGNNWIHCTSNKRFKEIFGSHTRETFNRFTTKVSYNVKIAGNTESTAV